MPGDIPHPITGRTRWRRFWVALGPAVAIVALMVYFTASGALAVSFAVNGTPFKLSADKLDGTNFVQIGSLNAVAACDPSNAASCAAGHQFTAATLLSNATIYNLKQTACADIPGFTSLTGLRGLVTLTAGDNSGVAANQPSASSLVVDATSLSGASATFDQGINIGQDFTGGAVPHAFSQQAPHVLITGLSQDGTDTAAGSFTLPNLHISATLVGVCP